MYGGSTKRQRYGSPCACATPRICSQAPFPSTFRSSPSTRSWASPTMNQWSSPGPPTGVAMLQLIHGSLGGMDRPADDSLAGAIELVASAQVSTTRATHACLRSGITAYRILAYVVGILLAFGSLVVLPMKYLLSEGSTLQQFGEDASIVWLLHGWIFAVYVVVTFFLARKARLEHRVHAARARGRSDPAADLLGRAPRHAEAQGREPRARWWHTPTVTTAFVLGGGGVLGAVEVGMLRALFERGSARPGARHQHRRVQRRPGGQQPDARRWSSGSTSCGSRSAAPARWGTATARCAGPPGGASGTHLLVGRAAAPAARGASSATSPSRSCRSPSRSARPASSAPPSTGSPAARWWTRWWRAPPYPGCCRPRRWTASTTSTAAS